MSKRVMPQRASGGRFVSNAPEDLWRRVDVRTPDECWPWKGPGDKDGYGRMKIGDGTVRAHRVAWALGHGFDPGDALVLHRCDNPPCCNPAHLFLGTHTDNVRDMHSKDRWVDRKGSRHPLAKLTEESVAEIRHRRAAGETGRALAREFGVAESRISTLVRHPERHWSHA